MATRSPIRSAWDDERELDAERLVHRDRAHRLHRHDVGREDHRHLFDRLEAGDAGPLGDVAREGARLDVGGRRIGGGEGVRPIGRSTLDDAALGRDLLEGDELGARLHLGEDVALALLEADVVELLGRAARGRGR